jgi:putative transposase
MALRKIKFIEGEYYHIYNRGNNKNIIFKDKEDYERFIGLMYACNQSSSFKSDDLKKDQGLFNVQIKEKIVNIGVYCLMPNHFHILITQRIDNGISIFMKKIMTAYVMYFNKKYERTEHVNKDNHLKYLFSYIHLNPIKLIQKDWKEKGIKNKKQVFQFLENYKYSSYLDFVGDSRVQNKILSTQDFPNYFSTKEKFKKEIFEWLSYPPLGKS